jgi:hypothetical protein
MAGREPAARPGEESLMSTNKKSKRPAVIPPGRDHLDELLDQALSQSFPASDPVAIDFDSPADRMANRKRGK